MTLTKPRYANFALYIGILLLSPAVVLGQTPIQSSGDNRVSDELASRLLSLAEEAITVQYQILVSGELENSLRQKKSAHLFREAMMSRYKAQIARRNILKETKQDYKDFKTKLTIKTSSREGNRITLTITERTRLKLDVLGGPEATEFIEDHLFDFVYEQQLWKIVGTRSLRPPIPPIQDSNQLLPDGPRMTPLTDAPPGYRSSSASRKSNNRSSLTVSFLQASLIDPLPQSNFDRHAAVTYARQHALSSNPQYYRFRNDCTNFVSQCMYAGGWQMIGFGLGLGRTNPDNWYYSCISSFGKAIASYSWGAAYNFNVFILRANRVQGIPYYQDLFPGDIIFADWDTTNGPHVPDGRVDHVMIVTGKDTHGNIYVSYHTNDNLDRPMRDIIAQEPVANFFGDVVR